MKTRSIAELSPTLEDELDHEVSYIAALPDNHEWTIQELDRLECLRRVALELARQADAVFATINGR